MNERIRELDAQSLVKSEGQWVFSKEKFAELIVRECAAVANINSHQWQVPGDFVLKHFGIDNGR